MAGQLAGLGVKAKLFLIFGSLKAYLVVTITPSLKNLTILQVVPELATGGAERTTIEVAQAIVQAGGRALVWSAGGRLLPELLAVGARHFEGYAASKNPWDVLVANPARLSEILVREKVDLIHARSRAPAWSALIAARRRNIAFVTTYHGIYAATSALKRWYNSVMVRSDAIIANSNYTKAHIMEQHGIEPDKVTVIYRGVDSAAFDPAAVTSARSAIMARKWKLDIPHRRPRVILPARLTEWKGQRIFIAALARLKNQGVDFEAILVGDSQGRDAYAHTLRTLISDAGLSHQVFLVGHCNDMPAAFSLCDIAVTPSIQPEAFGRTAAEAQAMGLPVIASDLGGARETVDPNVTGYLSAAGDVGALADYLGTLIQMPRAQRLAMGAAGYARVRALFTTQSLQSQTLALYQRVMAARHGE